MLRAWADRPRGRGAARPAREFLTMASAEVVPKEGTVPMIGRFDSTQNRWRAALLAIATLFAVVGGSITQAQAPRVKGVKVVPTPTAPPSLSPDAPADPGPVAGTPPGLAGDPPPGSMAVPGNEEPPKLDTRVVPAETLDEPDPKLPGAKLPPGGAPVPPGRPSAPESDPFTIHPDRLSPGLQRVQLSIEVKASSVINLGKESTVRLVVRNESNSDATGVSVVYLLPDALQLVTSTPEALPVPGDKPLYQWTKPMLAAGGDWVIVLKVMAKEAKACEHAATVTAKAGSRANAHVQEPKLKVEATATPGRLLMGKQVTFTIAVRNPGTGPARNVIVQAKLSNGLRLGNDDVVEQTIAEIKPGGFVELDPLTVDTVAGGQQTCTIEARSADVNTVVDDQRVTRSIDVTKPELTVKLTGEDNRYTGQTIDYKLAVTNPGTAPAKKVKVTVAMPPQGGKMISSVPDRASFDKVSRKMFWTIDQIEPGQTVDMTFMYMTSTPGLYRATAEATTGELRSSDTLSTDVSGIAVLDLQVTGASKLIDVGKTNFYDITIKNAGSKEALRLQLRGNLTKGKLKLLQHFNVEKGQFQYNVETGDFVFPEIDRLAVGQSITLSLEAQATASGPAGCHVFLGHADMGEEEAKVEDVVSTTITGSGRPRTAPKP
jgi:uncharacterized repeat protein (TIGR01451 family)